jgi:hypothetical protein
MNFKITEPEDLSKSMYFSFSYLIYFHRLFLHRCQRRFWKILLGFILCLLLAAAIGIPFLLVDEFGGEYKTKKNKIILVFL